MKEYYAFTWPGKREAIHEAGKAPTGSLRPCVELSKNFDTTQNLYIEGDNLEVLKLLQKSYMRKIKMIYIDPPYNTGHDFIYKDSFIQEVDEAADDYGLFNDDGEMNFSHEHYRENTRSNPRYHSDWCSMIYPRLKVAHNLLREDGVIFISIDDNEMVNLRKICDEIFGESNFIAMFPWRKRTAKSDVPFGVSQDYEYIIAYAKSSDFSASVEGKGRKYYETPDYPGRAWRIHDLTKQTTASERPNSYFTIINPKTGDEYPANPNRTWRVSRETFKRYYEAGQIIFPGDYDFLKISRPVFRYWKEDDERKAGENFGRMAVSTKLPDDVGMSQDGTRETTELLGGKIFSFPKPVSLIRYLISTATKDDDIILDFFSGSSTTAHAVMQLNAEDSGTRKFIMVQLPEDCQPQSEAFRAGYKTICDIGRERIRRAGESLTGDTGFRVLKLDSNNFHDVYVTPDELTQDMLDDMVDNIKPDRSGLDLLFGFAAACGLPLSLPYRSERIEGFEVHVYGDGEIVACFEPCVPQSVIIAMAKTLPVRGLFRDSCFASSQDKLNALQLFDGYAPDAAVTVL